MIHLYLEFYFLFNKDDIPLWTKSYAPQRHCWLEKIQIIKYNTSDVNIYTWKIVKMLGTIYIKNLRFSLYRERWDYKGAGVDYKDRLLIFTS